MMVSPGLIILHTILSTPCSKKQHNPPINIPNDNYQHVYCQWRGNKNLNSYDLTPLLTLQPNPDPNNLRVDKSLLNYIQMTEDSHLVSMEEVLYQWRPLFRPHINTNYQKCSGKFFNSKSGKYFK